MHDDTIRREFSKQAASFEDPDYLFAARGPLAWIQSHVPPAPGEAILDVAGGTGLLARAYSEAAAVAVVLDLTDEMLAVGQRETRAAGRRNVVFVRADARSMPFPEGSFDLVMGRFAVHHFEEPRLQIAEMVRVCREGGRIAIIDLVAADDDLRADHDRLERLRDPSHTTVLSLDELRGALRSAGATILADTSIDHELVLERWLSQAGPPAQHADTIRAAVQAHLDRGEPCGLRPVLVDGEARLTHRYAIVSARR